MSEISRAINQFFKEATKPEISEVENKVNFTDHLYLVYKLYYIEHKDINYIKDVTNCSRGKIEADLRLIRKQLWKII